MGLSRCSLGTRLRLAAKEVFRISLAAGSSFCGAGGWCNSWTSWMLSCAEVPVAAESVEGTGAGEAGAVFPDWNCFAKSDVAYERGPASFGGCTGSPSANVAAGEERLNCWAKGVLL